jgi:hypothetical protein
VLGDHEDTVLSPANPLLCLGVDPVRLVATEVASKVTHHA